MLVRYAHSLGLQSAEERLNLVYSFPFLRQVLLSVCFYHIFMRQRICSLYREFQNLRCTAKL